MLLNGKPQQSAKNNLQGQRNYVMSDDLKKPHMITSKDFSTYEIQLLIRWHCGSRSAVAAQFWAPRNTLSRARILSFRYKLF